MTPVEALKLALTKEEGSITLYRSLLKDHSEIRELLETMLTALPAFLDATGPPAVQPDPAGTV